MNTENKVALLKRLNCQERCIELAFGNLDDNGNIVSIELDSQIVHPTWAEMSLQEWEAEIPKICKEHDIIAVDDLHEAVYVS